MPKETNVESKEQEVPEKTLLIAQKEKEKFVICEMCGHANPENTALCKMCSNYLKGAL